MRYSESEIIEAILDYVRQAGGPFQEWRVGTAYDTQAPIFTQHGAGESADKLICREAYTTFAAAEVIERLTQAFDLPHAQETSANGGKRGPAKSSSPTARPRPLPLNRKPSDELGDRRDVIQVILTGSGLATRPPCPQSST